MDKKPRQCISLNFDFAFGLFQWQLLCMDDATKRTKRVAFQPPAIKPNYSKLNRSPKKRARLDASQNALRVVEQAIGAKLVVKKSSH